MKAKENNETRFWSVLYNIRGKRCVVDYELADIYGYSYADFTEMIKEHLMWFDEKNRFQITENELNGLILSDKLKMLPFADDNGNTILPYVYTEEGYYILITVLKEKLDAQITIGFLEAFRDIFEAYARTTDYFRFNCLYRMLKRFK